MCICDCGGGVSGSAGHGYMHLAGYVIVASVLPALGEVTCASGRMCEEECSCGCAHCMAINVVVCGDAAAAAADLTAAAVACWSDHHLFCLS